MNSPDHDFRRYIRQACIPGFGPATQARLQSSRVVVAGLGGLGGPVCIYLACAGVGTLRMIDFQEVEYSNLNRQILFDEADVGRSKCQVAAERIQEINHATRIESLATRLVRENARELVANSDVVVDAFDNREAKQVVNEACVAEGIPLVHAGIYGLECGVTSIIPRSSPCLRCIYPKPARRVESQPVLGPVAGLAACIEATEAIKLVTGLGEPITGRMLLIDMKIGMFSERKISRNAACPVCGQER